MTKLGYIRTSTSEQISDRQINELRDICDQIFIEDGVSAVQKKRPVYDDLIRTLKSGDELIISAVDRAYRDTVDALTEFDKLSARGIKFTSLAQPFDATTPDGKFMFTLAAALATWERDIIISRTKQGMDAARKRGAKIGRPKKLTEEDILAARRALESELYSSLTELAEHFRVHEKTLERALGLDHNLDEYK